MANTISFPVRTYQHFFCKETILRGSIQQRFRLLCYETSLRYPARGDLCVKKSQSRSEPITTYKPIGSPNSEPVTTCALGECLFHRSSRHDSSDKQLIYFGANYSELNSNNLNHNFSNNSNYNSSDDSSVDVFGRND